MLPHVSSDALILGVAPCVTGIIVFVLALRQGGAFQLPFALQRKDKGISIQANAGSIVLILSLLLAGVPLFLLYQVAHKEDSASELKEFKATAKDLKEQLSRIKSPGSVDRY